MYKNNYEVKTKISDVKKGLIRPANIKDSEELTKLYLIGGKRFLSWIYGKKFEEICRDIVKTNYTINSTYLFEIDNKIVGLLSAYPTDYNKKEDPTEHNRLIKKHLRGLDWIYFLNRVRKTKKYLKNPKNSFHIAIISVYKEFRQKGIGSILLLYGEKLAINQGYNYIFGEIRSDNIASIKTCEKHGYKIEFEVPFKKLSKKYGKNKDLSWLHLIKYLY